MAACRLSVVASGNADLTWKIANNKDMFWQSIRILVTLEQAYITIKMRTQTLSGLAHEYAPAITLIM